MNKHLQEILSALLLRKILEFVFLRFFTGDKDENDAGMKG